MDLKKFFLEQLEIEAAASRKAIERAPEGHNSFKPHPRSMEFGYLASLVATMPGWVAMVINQDLTDIDGADSGFRTRSVESRAELLRLLDEGHGKSRTALEGTTEEHLMKPWGLRMGGQILTQGPRYSQLREGVLSHLAHHRGQLTVYLRLLESKVPAIYGPSADEMH
ncbi:MAG TPA: DinB family protein [Acidobacteriaceae bacterium]|nr:DinB family protein [Acidobacteriaceae bacterium]